MITQAEMDEYPNLSGAQQAQIREAVFSQLTALLISIKRYHSRGDAVMAELDALQSFVQLYVSDFNADGTTGDAVTARNSIRDEVVNYANRQTGISGATRS